MGISSDLVRCCIGLFDNNSTDLISKPVFYNCGLQQGSALSPLLYSIFINELTEILEALPAGYKTSVCDYAFCWLFFADDIALISSGPDKRLCFQCKQNKSLGSQQSKQLQALW
jgi:hypothetical protein